MNRKKAEKRAKNRERIAKKFIKYVDAFINKWQRSDIAKILKNRLFLLTVLIFQILM